MVDSPLRSEQNVDPNEIARFARLSDEWWAPRGKFKALHALTPARMQFIRDVCVAHFPQASNLSDSPDPMVARATRQPLLGKTAVDVGCGGGLASEPLARLGATVTAIDPARENIEIAKSHAERAGLQINYRATSAEELVDEGQTFDLVISLEVIEHVPSPDAFVETCSRLVAPGGLMVLSTINRTARAYALAIVAGEYILNWLERGTHDWNKFITPNELTVMLQQNGFKAMRPRGTVYDPIRDRWLLSRDVSVNYMLAAARPG